MAYFTVREQIGPKRAITREGFLLCSDVPVGRLGLQRYAPEEIAGEDGKPLIQGVGGVLMVDRVPEEVFHPAAIASGNGKPFVDDHPMDGDERIDVTPENWRDLACGAGMNLRRGAGLDDDLLLADILVTHKDTIQKIQDGKREISIGYDCDYFETGPGRAEQRNIRINHFALVDAGRCGPRCAIGDSATPYSQGRATSMTTLKDWIMGQARRIRDAAPAEAEKIAAETPPPEVAGAMAAPAAGGTHLHVHTGGGVAGGTATTGEQNDDRGRDRRDDDRGRDRRDMGRRREEDRGYGRRDDRSGRDTTTDDPDGEGGDNEALQRRLEALEDQHEEIMALLDELSGEMGIGSEDWGRMRDDVMRRRDSRGRDDRHSRDRRGRDDRHSRDRRDDRGRDDRGRDARGWRDDRGRGRDEPEGREEREDGGRSILGNLEEEAPPGTGDRARRARDSEYLGDAFQQTAAYAEMIAPGIDIPAFDQAARPAKTFDAICGLRRAALGRAYGTPEGRARIDEVTGSRTFDAKTLDCSRVRGLFLSVGAITKLANNMAARTGDAAAAGGHTAVAGPAKVVSIAAINATNEKFWRDQQTGAV